MKKKLWPKFLKCCLDCQKVEVKCNRNLSEEEIRCVFDDN